MLELVVGKICKYQGPQGEDRMVKVIGENGDYKLLRDQYHNYFITCRDIHILSLLVNQMKQLAITAYQEKLIEGEGESYSDLNSYFIKTKEYSNSIRENKHVVLGSYEMEYDENGLPVISKDDEVLFKIYNFQDADDIVTHYNLSDTRRLEFTSLKGNNTLPTKEEKKLQRIVEQAESYHAYCLANNYDPPFTTIVITPEVEVKGFLQKETGFIQGGGVGAHNPDEFPLRSVGTYYGIPIFVLNKMSLDFQWETISLIDLVRDHNFIIQPDWHKEVDLWESTANCRRDSFSNVLYIVGLRIVKNKGEA